MLEKKPRNAVQYAAAVAYYYRFEAPPAEKKQFIDKDDLQQATRKSGRDRFENPLQTLNNAHTLGLLDRGPEKAGSVSEATLAPAQAFYRLSQGVRGLNLAAQMHRSGW